MASKIVTAPRNFPATICHGVSGRRPLRLAYMCARRSNTLPSVGGEQSACARAEVEYGLARECIRRLGDVLGE